MRPIVWLLVCFSAIAANGADEVRTWTDSQGGKMQAQFVREVDGDVTFLKDGKLITLPLDTLSPEDQKFIREAEAKKKLRKPHRPPGRRVRRTIRRYLSSHSRRARQSRA